MVAMEALLDADIEKVECVWSKQAETSWMEFPNHIPYRLWEAFKIISEHEPEYNATVTRGTSLLRLRRSVAGAWIAVDCNNAKVFIQEKTKEVSLEAEREKEVFEALPEHPAICQLIDMEKSSNGTYFMVYKFYEGFDLLQRIHLKCKERRNNMVITPRSHGHDPAFIHKLHRMHSMEAFGWEDEALRIIKPILEAVRFLHHNGVAHRDIVPSSIMFSDDQVVTTTNNIQQ